MMKDKTALSTRKTGISYLCIGYAISLLFSGFSGLQSSVSGMKDLEAGIFAEWIEYVKGFRLNDIAFPGGLLVFPLSTVITALPPITLTYLALEVFNRVSVLPRLFPDGGIFSVRGGRPRPRFRGRRAHPGQGAAHQGVHGRGLNPQQLHREAP